MKKKLVKKMTKEPSAGNGETPPVIGNRVSCTCNSCKAACQKKPGWFLHGEAEKVAEHLKISLQKLFNDYLAVDWYCDDKGNDYFPLSPAVVGNETGAMFPYKPSGTCVFFDSGKCKIHPVAPYECQQYHHTQENDETRKRHEYTAKSWTDEKQQTKLLGTEPCRPEPESFMDMFGFGW